MKDLYRYNCSEEENTNCREVFAFQDDKMYIHTVSQGKKRVQKLSVLYSLNTVKGKEAKSQHINNWLIYLSKIFT